MRFTLSALALLAAFPAGADTIEARSHITAVTVFPGLAQVTREVEVKAPAGVNRLVVPDLPAGLTAEALRVSGSGVSIGAVSIASGRQPATADLTDPGIMAAQDEVDRLTEALAEKQSAAASILLDAQAAQDELAFLRGLNQRAPAASVDDLRAQAQMVGEEALAAARRAFDATEKARRAELALKPDREALEKAKQALAALKAGGRHTTLIASVEGSGKVEIVTYTPDADWQPVYDIRLDRKAGTLTLDRGVSVTQASGEDWTEVALTLSTARPTGQMAPSELSPDLVFIAPPGVTVTGTGTFGLGYDAPAPAPAAPVAKARAVTAHTELLGATVTYRYPDPATVRSGTDAVRFALDNVTLKPETYAQAVPTRDATAFLMAKAKNDSGQVLLPGPAVLFADGAVVGGTDLALTAPGTDLTLGFGSLDAIRLSVTTPQKSTGDRGILTRANESHEVTVLKVENLSGEDWPLRVLGQIPYSEQDALTVKAKIDPQPAETDTGGKRGLMVWKTTLGAGKSYQIHLDTTLDWPAGQVLQ